MNDKILNPEPISKEEKYFNSKLKEDDFSIPSMPDFNSFGELPEGYQINEFGEIVKEKGKSK